MVYPGAVHSRFEHSLGVYWLAGETAQRLKNFQVLIWISVVQSHFDLSMVRFVMYVLNFL